MQFKNPSKANLKCIVMFSPSQMSLPSQYCDQIVAHVYLDVKNVGFSSRGNRAFISRLALRGWYFMTRPVLKRACRFCKFIFIAQGDTYSQRNAPKSDSQKNKLQEERAQRGRALLFFFTTHFARGVFYESPCRSGHKYLDKYLEITFNRALAKNFDYFTP